MRVVFGQGDMREAGIPAVALGCCEGEHMHARTERIRADSIVIGAEQLHAVLAEVLKLTPSAAGSALGKPIDN